MIKGYKILSKMIRYWIQISTFVVIQFNLMKTILMIMKHPGKIKSAVTQGHHHTLDSVINIGVRLLIFGFFSRGYVLIKESNP